MKVTDFRRQESDSRERVAQIEAAFRTDAWQAAKRSVREQYVHNLQNLPVDADLERFRLVEAIKVIDLVEKHINKAYSEANVNLKKVTKRDFKESSGFFR